MSAVLRHYMAPFQRHLDDPGVTDIVVNRPGEIGVEKAGVWTWYDAPILVYDVLRAIAYCVAYESGQDVSMSHPLCAAELPSGERIQICIPRVVPPGTVSLSIRRSPDFRPRLEAMRGLFESRDMTALQDMVPDAWQGDRLRSAVLERKNVIIAGATGSGKTTLAKALIEEIPLTERLITIEDTYEWGGIPHRNRVALKYSKGGQGAAQVTSVDLIEASLRMRPDRVLMQELRDDAAFTYLRGVAAGHPGCITTLHAGSARGAFDALRLMIGPKMDKEDARELLEQHVHVVVHCERRNNAFRVTEIYP